MENLDKQILYGLAKTVEGLAKTVESNGIELGALRLTTQALFGAVSFDPQMTENFAAAIVRVMEADKAVMLNTPLSDQTLELRTQWMLRLLPEHIRLRVQQLMPT